MAEPVVAQKSPYPIAVEAAKTYYWCACGLSKSQPFCDGSHKGTGLTPTPYTAVDSKTVYFCGCKGAKTAPFCDGTHTRM